MAAVHQEHEQPKAERTALIVVDVQNDFTEGGPFRHADGNDAVARRIGEFVAATRNNYAVVVATQDWHIEPKDHFERHAPHCIAETIGADLDPELSAGAERDIRELIDVFVRKGQYDHDYSAFLGHDSAGQSLESILRSQGITNNHVCGFAQDVCVAATVRDGLAAGFRMSLIEDLAPATTPDASRATLSDLRHRGVTIVASDAVHSSR